LTAGKRRELMKKIEEILDSAELQRDGEFIFNTDVLADRIIELFLNDG